MRKRISIKTKMAGAGALALLVVLGITIAQINAITSNVYSMNALKQELKALKKEQRALESSKASILSFSTMEHLASSLNFERVRTVSYIEVLGGSVAQRPSSNQ